MSELQGLQSRLAEFRAAGAEVVAISSDSEEHAREIAEALGIDYAMLSDPALEAIDAYGLRHESGGMDGDIARPATFIVDRDGRVAWRELTDNWRIRPRARDVLEVVKTLD
jgi:peroxiredoxin